MRAGSSNATRHRSRRILVIKRPRDLPSAPRSMFAYLTLTHAAAATNAGDNCGSAKCSRMVDLILTSAMLREEERPPVDALMKLDKQAPTRSHICSLRKVAEWPLRSLQEGSRAKYPVVKCPIGTCCSARAVTAVTSPALARSSCRLIL